MLYLVQVIAYTGIFYMVYMLLLRNKPMHQFNRAYLLSIIVLPVIIPFVRLSSLTSYFEQNRIVNMRLPDVIINGVQEQRVVNSTIDWALLGYTAIALLMIVLFIRKWMKLSAVIKHSEKIQEADYTLLLNTSHGPGSWGKYILLPDEQIHETIVQHEAAHIRLKHSKDIILVNLVQCLFWPNLFLQAIKQELKQLHEFQADAAVGMDRQQYSELLLANVFNTCTLPLTHSFNIHPIKRRIRMLKKRTSKPLAIAIGLVTVLATSALLFNIVALQSCKPKKWEVMQATQVDKMAEFKGDYIKFMSENIVYPKEALYNNIEGRVTVQITVGEDGVVRNAKVLSENYQGPGTADVKLDSGILAKAALEVVGKMPKWLPAEKNGKKVAVVFTMPISFKLPENELVSVNDDPILKAQFEDAKKIIESSSASSKLKYIDDGQLVAMIQGNLVMQKFSRSRGKTVKDVPAMLKELENSEK
jgi:TonB family protein